MSALALAGLLLVALGWVALPLIPALREFFRPTDAEPLVMVGRDNADIARFARHFREYVTRQFAEVGPAVGERFPDGTPFLRASNGLPAGAIDRLVVAERPLQLRGGEQFRLEVWARDAFTGGPGAVYRAVLGDRTVRLGPESVVLRWVHAAGALVVGERSHLYGRASSEAAIRLERAVGFDRLGAPVVVAGDAPPGAMPPRPEGMLRFEAPERARTLGDHLRLEGDVVVPSGAVVEGNLVVAGSLRLLAGARVAGSVKAHRAVELQAGAVVEGSLVSRGEVLVGADCWVRGPVISEEHLHLGRGTTVGAPDGPSTVSGRTVSLAMGAVVCGHVVTQEGGQTAE
jgi:hypothetical protein